MVVSSLQNFVRFEQQQHHHHHQQNQPQLNIGDLINQLHQQQQNNQQQLQFPMNQQFCAPAVVPQEQRKVQGTQNFPMVESFSARSNTSLMSLDSHERGGGAASPISVLPPLGGPANLLGASVHQPKVITAQGIAQINNNAQKCNSDAGNWSDILLGTFQPGVQPQQLVNNNVGDSLPLMEGFNVQGQPLQVQQVDLMQQILTNPFGNPLFKTELCRAYDETGYCRFGDRCKYAHGRGELKPALRCSNYKTKICKTFVEEGCCPYGSRCNFIHTPVKLPQQVQDACSNSPLVSERSSSPSAGSASSNCPSSISSPRRLPIFVWLTQIGSQEE